VTISVFERLARRVLQVGAATFQAPDGRTFVVGDPVEAERLVVEITSNPWLARLARRPSMAFGEAYMDGGLVLHRGTIYDLLDLIGRNFANRPDAKVSWVRLLTRYLDQANNRHRSRRNVAAHYDLSLALYRLFLDEDLQYSCAYFARPGMTLEEAQVEKKARLARKLLLKPGVRLLDIGCGWGGLGLTMAEAGAQVTGVTLSTEQLATAQARAIERGLTDRAEFRLQDYRDVPETFDRVVSVGMLEHVGLPQMETYFQTVARHLADDGVAVIHSIGRAHGPNTTQPWIARYIFPGGYIPALSEVLPAIERAGLWVTDVEILRLHYAETLKAWAERFAARRAEAAVLYDERFCRMWEFYLAASEVAFRWGDHMVFQLQLAKRRDVVPLTRDYLC
jgi:cyclopropane-fatty-acyl-phospholipid synthase